MGSQDPHRTRFPSSESERRSKRIATLPTIPELEEPKMTPVRAAREERAAAAKVMREQLLQPLGLSFPLPSEPRQTSRPSSTSSEDTLCEGGEFDPWAQRLCASSHCTCGFYGDVSPYISFLREVKWEATLEHLRERQQQHFAEKEEAEKARANKEGKIMRLLKALRFWK